MRELIEKADDCMDEFLQIDNEELGTVIETEAKAQTPRYCARGAVEGARSIQRPMGELSKNLEDESTAYKKMVKILSGDTGGSDERCRRNCMSWL
jgi:hypothetical protein